MNLLEAMMLAPLIAVQEDDYRVFHSATAEGMQAALTPGQIVPITAPCGAKVILIDGGIPWSAGGGQLPAEVTQYGDIIDCPVCRGSRGTPTGCEE